jgi:hypothetical protein
VTLIKIACVRHAYQFMNCGFWKDFLFPTVHIQCIHIDLILEIILYRLLKVKEWITSTVQRYIVLGKFYVY